MTLKEIKVSLSILVSLFLFTFSVCLTSQKMDQFIAKQFDENLPAVPKQKTPGLNVNFNISFKPVNALSVTTKKTSKVLPLIVYIHFDYRHTTVLNPAIAVSSFQNLINQQSGKLTQKLNGRQLELTVEQVPQSFAIVDKASILLIVIHWDRIYIEPGAEDLLVSYRLTQNGVEVKSNRIRVKNEEGNKVIRFAQSWRSSTSEYLAQYDENVKAMSKTFITKLIEEL